MDGGSRCLLSSLTFVCPWGESSIIYRSEGSEVPISLHRMNYERDSRKCKLINWNSGPEVLWVDEGFESES